MLASALKQAGYPPMHYIPRKDVDMAQLERTSHQTRLSDGSGTASRHRTDDAVSGVHESRRDALLEWPQTQEAEGTPVERLHFVVAELCRALSNALRDEREAAQE
ncbi:MAG TPA: DUF427 domain-containing protein, partial [Steroidobacteraceae bacterium]|nr:DUF427 domain-containing protein [Steroidobacteraceae bacterium]